MNDRPQKSPINPYQVPAAIRLGLEHIMKPDRPNHRRPDSKHEHYVRIRELGLS